MKDRKILIGVLVVVLMVACVPLTALANENDTMQRQTVDLLQDFVIVDKNGNIVPQLYTVIDEGIELGAGWGIRSNKTFYYGGGFATFNASVTGGHVDELRVESKPVGGGSWWNIGYFTATSGDWYGELIDYVYDSSSGTYTFSLFNNGSATITVDSWTVDLVNV
ncbi:MAG: hypothetical protein LBL49_10815 [Clostridiales Family XIII bacterium]|jgi:hypothetical protein|nr:hypothetical protein [Clostridiales Family XIII bacterium]